MRALVAMTLLSACEPASTREKVPLTPVSLGDLNTTPLETGGTGHSSPRDFVAFEGWVYFTAGDAGFYAPRWLYRTDGTAAGTVAVRRFPDGIRNLAVADGRLFFSANNDRHWTVFASDGTAEGTHDLGGTILDPGGYLVLGDRYLVEPRAAGTPLIASEPGVDAMFVLAPDAMNLTRVSSTHAVFTNRNGTIELWVTDGTRIGTHIVARPPWWGLPMAMGSAGGLAYFVAPVTEDKQPALYRTDGTEEGTFKVVDLPRDEWRLFPAGDEMFFANVPIREDSPPRTLFHTNGAPGNVSRIAGGFGFLSGIVSLGHELFVLADGRPFVIRNDRLEPLLVPTRIGSMQAIGSRLLMVASHDIWLSNGVTSSRLDAPHLRVPHGFTAIGPRVFFTAATESMGEEPWVMGLP
jgi:hypothetical protein